VLGRENRFIISRATQELGFSRQVNLAEGIKRSAEWYRTTCGATSALKGASLMEVLVTGGNGFVGRHLIPALQERGDNVRVLVQPGENTSWLGERGVAVHSGDVRQPETLVAPMHGAEGVLHLAAMMDDWRPIKDYYAVNVTGTENVCRAALAEGVRRLVHVSSLMVYGMALGKPAREDFPLAPYPDPYSVTKAEGDKVVQQMIAKDHLPAVILRPDQIFGPGDHLHFGRLADRLRTGRGIIVGRGRNVLPLLYVTDAVQGLLLALEHERAVGQAYNIANDRPLTQQEFLQAIAQEIGAKRPRFHVPYRVLYSAGYAAEHLATLTGSSRRPPVTRLGVLFLGTDSRLAIDKARRDLGYTPRVTVREGVRLAAAWYRHSVHSAAGASPAVSRAAE
jgi:nucleoside-diphosphate-sugar epimerase